jgi:hypothetical protein
VEVRAIVAACALTATAASALPAAAQGAIAFRDASSANTPIVAVSLPIPRPPSLAVGDVMVATIAIKIATLTPPTPAGWSLAVDTVDGTSLRQLTFFKVADASDVAAASFTFALGGSTRGMGGIAAYSGVDPANPLDTATGVASGASGLSAAAPRITTANLRAGVVVATGWTLNQTVTADGATTERYKNASANNGVLEAAELFEAAPGQIPQVTVTTTPAPARWIAQSIALNEMPALTASFPSDYAWSGLTPGSTTDSPEQTVSVTSNRAWGLQIASDRSDGRARQWNGSAYGSLTLTNPMQWRTTSIGGNAQSTSFADLSGTAATAVHQQSASAGAVAVGVTYRQQVSYADEAALPAGNTYRQNVSYTAQQGF